MFNALSFATISDCVRHISFVKQDIDTTLFQNWQDHLIRLAESLPPMQCQVDRQGVLRLKFPFFDHILFFYLCLHQKSRPTLNKMTSLCKWVS